MTTLILPAAVLAAMTAVMYLVTTLIEVVRLRRRVARQDPSPNQFSEAPDWLDRPRRNYNSLLQMPVLFYAVVALELRRDGVDVLQVQLAWAYVLVRLVHSAVYLAFNPVWLRVGLLTASFVILTAMWARLVIGVL